MNAEEIKTKAKWLSEIYAAKANGEVLQLWDATTEQWADHSCDYGPTLQSYMSNWRLKPKPRRMWEVEYTKAQTDSSDTAKKWKASGYTVTEWVEVIPG